jgi:hypothetical protein
MNGEAPVVFEPAGPEAAVCAGLVALIERLPLRDDLPPRTLESEAISLMWAAALFRANDRPHAKKAGGIVARRELTKLRKLALADHIETMHRDALDSVLEQQQGKEPHPRHTGFRARRLADAAAMAHDTIEPTPPLPLNTKRPAASLTKYAAAMFERLTGKPVTRVSKTEGEEQDERQVEDGPFKNFLAGAFELVGIDAKPGGQVRAFVEFHRRKTAM